MLLRAVVVQCICPAIKNPSSYGILQPQKRVSESGVPIPGRHAGVPAPARKAAPVSAPLRTAAITAGSTSQEWRGTCSTLCDIVAQVFSGLPSHEARLKVHPERERERGRGREAERQRVRLCFTFSHITPVS
jgi:hypothetical protein